LVDLSVKIELLIMESVSGMFWTSAMEGGTFLVALLLFLSSPSELASVWWFIPHAVRSITGFFILTKLPSTHQILEKSSIPLEERLSFEEIFEYIARSGRDAIESFGANSKRLLLFYFYLTLICGAIDVVFLWRTVGEIKN
jgi:hypothetical protein